MDIWLDVTANTSWQYFDQAKQAISNAIDTMIMPNSDGAVIWISLISHNSYQPQSNIMTLVIPKIESDPLMPLPQPLPAKTGNPFADAAAAKKVEAENKAAYEQWQQTLAHNHQRLAHIRAQVKQQTDQLRALYPAIDPQPPDLWGMVERSAERLQQAQGQKLLLVETSLSQTTWSQFRTGAALWGTRVKVVWNACGSDSTASECQQSSAFWHGVFVHAHATSVRMYDPAQSQTIQDLLD